MKKILLCLLAALMLVSLAVPGVQAAEGKNLLRNGSFDTPDTSYWWFRPDWGGGTMQYASTHGVDGTGCIVAIGNGAGGDKSAGMTYNAPENWGAQEQYLKLNEGEIYTFSYDVKRSSKATVEISVHNSVWTPVSFKNMSNVSGEAGSLKASKTGEWETVSGKFTAPAGEIIIRIAAVGLAQGEQVFFDNITLTSDSGKQQPDFEEVPIDPNETLGDNLLINGSFNDTNIDYWWLRYDWNGGVWSYSTDGGVDDSPCFFVFGEGNGETDRNAGFQYVGPENQGATEEYLELESGKEYVFQADFFIPETVFSGARFLIDINFGQYGSASCITRGQWETVKIRFTAPEEPLVLRIIANALPDAQYAMVDNVMMREVGAIPTPVEEDPVEEESVPSIRLAAAASNPSQPKENAGFPLEWILVIAGGVVVIAAVIVILIVRSRKKKGEKES